MSVPSRPLYEQVILDHNKHPRNFRAIEGAGRLAEGSNPLCGDHFTFYFKMDGTTILDAAFEGAGCAISKASASIMTTVLQGKTREEAACCCSRFQAMLASDPSSPIDEGALGTLAVFAGVRHYPVRSKCALLPWRALQAALEEQPPASLASEAGGP